MKNHYSDARMYRDMYETERKRTARLREVLISIAVDVHREVNDVVWVGDSETLVDRICNELGLQYDDILKKVNEKKQEGTDAN